MNKQINPEETREIKDKFYLLEIANTYGTPSFIIDLDKIRENVSRFKSAFNGNVLLSYSFKTNGHRNIIDAMNGLGAYSEVVSGMELDLSKLAGVEYSKMIFNGPGKKEEDIQKAVEKEIFLINSDSLDELVKLGEISKRLKKTVSVGLRVNPEIEVLSGTGAVSFTTKTSKFGLKDYEVAQAMQILHKNPQLKLNALHSQLGTQITDPQVYGLALRKLDRIIRSNGLEIKYLDLGGGFASESTLNSNGTSIQDFSNVINKEMRDLHPSYTLIFEPGRYLIEESGSLVSKIRSVKGNKLILDTGSNFLVPLQSAKYKVSFFSDEPKTQTYDFYGNLCFGADVVELGVKSPKLNLDDLVLIQNCGAYTLSMANQFIHLLPNILIKSGKEIKSSFVSRFIGDFLGYSD